MSYASLAECVADLEKHQRLVRIDAPVDAHQEVAAIQRRAFLHKAPALLFTRVKDCSFPMLANLFGTRERIHFLFRHTLPALEFLFKVKADPRELLRKPWKALSLPRTLYHALPKKRACKRIEDTVFACETRIDNLPQLVSWPHDGGAFVTLPLVYSDHPHAPGLLSSNLGMYRVQLTGNDYVTNKEVGIHYQMHRGIAEHHMAALQDGKALPVHIFVGGAPAMTLAAVMPLPDNMSELLFAGALGGRRIVMSLPPYAQGVQDALPAWEGADFCISGTLLPQCKPEGPFGDHLGYYSLTHDFPALQVHKVYHRKDAIWPFTSVGRPPQEDTMFGEFIHDLTGPLVPQVFRGVHEVHAVDAAGVHPLLLAIGSERYTPFAQERRPQELLTCACQVLGTTQTALAKYCFMAAKEDDTHLTTHDIPAYFTHMLERTRLHRDLHFLTKATIDTLDYSGSALNEGSKLIWTAAGTPCRTLGIELPAHIPLPHDFSEPRLFAPGIVLLKGSPDTRSHAQRGDGDVRLEKLALALQNLTQRDQFPLVVVVDDVDFVHNSWENFLWVTFTRSDPATDIYGALATVRGKHWACEAPLIIDARLKAFQAPPLEEDPDVVRRIEALGVRGGPLHGYI